MACVCTPRSSSCSANSGILGVGFSVADLRSRSQFPAGSAALRELRRCSPAVDRPAVSRSRCSRSARCSSVLIVYKLAFLQHGTRSDVFGETMMLVYYGYALPLSLKIGRGFYEDGIWADAGFIPLLRTSAG